MLCVWRCDVVLTPARPPHGGGLAGGLVAATAAVLVVLVLLWCLPACSFEPASTSAKHGGGQQQQHAKHSRRTATKHDIDTRPKGAGGNSWIYKCLPKFPFQRMAKYTIPCDSLLVSIPNAGRHSLCCTPLVWVTISESFTCLQAPFAPLSPRGPRHFLISSELRVPPCAGSSPHGRVSRFGA